MKKKQFRKYTPEGGTFSYGTSNEDGHDTTYISSGGHGIVGEVKVSLHDSLDGERSQEITLVQKTVKDHITKFEVDRQLYVHYLIKKAGIKTFTTFRADREQNFYSTPLNSNGFVALSSNNDGPIVDNEKFNKKFSIQNIDALIDTIIGIGLKASAMGIDIGDKDSLLFLIDTNDLKDGERAVDVSLGIYDFDSVYKSEQKGSHGTKNIQHLAANLRDFVRKHAVQTERDKYCKMIDDRLAIAVREKQIYVQSGLIDIDDRTEEKGEPLQSKSIVVQEDWTQEEVLHICTIPGIVVNLTDCSQDIKDSIRQVEGTLIDYNRTVSYKMLNAIIGDAYFNNLTSAQGLEQLQYIFGDAVFITLECAEGFEQLQLIGKHACFNNLKNPRGLENLKEIGIDGHFNNLLSLTGLKAIIKGNMYFCRRLDVYSMEYELQVGGMMIKQ